MKRILWVTLIITCLSISSSRTQQAPQSFIGRISDSMCGASHQGHPDSQPTAQSPRGGDPGAAAALGTPPSRAGKLTDRQCIFDCLKALAKWVLVDQNNNVFVIANQDLPGLPLYAGRPVRLMGELKGDTILASRVEAYPPHLHIFHVMTNWRDTPGGVGFLTAAISDARVAVTHANLAAKNPENLDEMKLHAGHVLHALDPSIEPKGPGSGYGVKRAAGGAQQHLDFAVKAEGATANVKTHATHVTASLGDALQWTDEAVTVAQKIRAATTAAEAAPLVKELSALTAKIADGVDTNSDNQVGWQTGEGGLAQAQAHMMLMMKGEGIENAPR